jgi:hypothetical protein
MNVKTTDTPSTGTGVDGAAAAIERMLARESGEPDAREQRRKPAPAEAGEAEAQQADDEDETQGEPETEEQDTPEEEEAAAEEDDEPESEEEAEPEEQETEEQPDPAKQLVTVKIDGKDEQLPLEEVIRGYQRQADYTRKTQALADERKSFEAEATAVRTERNQYGTLLVALQRQLEALQPKEPDWQKLYEENPLEYVRQRDVWRERQDRIAAAKAEQQRLLAIHQTETAEQRQQHLREERDKLWAANPAWKDEGKWKEARQQIREYGRAQGWTDEQLSDVTDHRAILTLWKAMQFDKAMRQKPPAPKPPQSRTTAPAPGARTVVPRAVSDLTRAKQRLAKTHDVRDAAAVIERLL